MFTDLTDLTDQTDQTIRLGIVLGGAAVAFVLCALSVLRLRRALAHDAISAAIHPYRLNDLDQSAQLASDQISARYARAGLLGYAVVVLDLLAWTAVLSMLVSAASWGLQSARGSGPGLLGPLGWLPYAPAVAVLSGFAALLYLLAHSAERRDELRLARWMRRLLPLSAIGYRDPDCSGQFDILSAALLARSRATQQAARDQVAELAHSLLPQARRLADEDLKRTVESAVAFVPRQSGHTLDTDRFAELLRLFDALFGRLREDTGHQDIWRIAILRQLIRYTGPNVLPEIFGQIQVRPDGAGIDGLSVMRSRRAGDPSTADSSVLNTAFGRPLAEPDPQGLGLIVDLTRAQRENAADRDDDLR